MESGVSAEELAKIAGVKATTVRKIAHELLELLERDLESQGVTVRSVGSQ
jgi:DNA-directed RNA polymerase specialized sigma24 family protein